MVVFIAWFRVSGVGVTSGFGLQVTSYGFAVCPQFSVVPTFDIPHSMPFCPLFSETVGFRIRSSALRGTTRRVDLPFLGLTYNETSLEMAHS